MRLPSIKVLAVAVLAVATVGFAANQVFASVPTVKGKGKLLSSFSAIVTATTFVNEVTEVPDNQTFVITDVIATNASESDNAFALRCAHMGGGTKDLFPLIEVPAHSSFTHSFGTGLECTEHDTLNMSPEATNAAFKVVVVGYFRKGL